MVRVAVGIGGADLRLHICGVFAQGRFFFGFFSAVMGYTKVKCFDCVRCIRIVHRNFLSSYLSCRDLTAKYSCMNGKSGRLLGTGKHGPAAVACWLTRDNNFEGWTTRQPNLCTRRTQRF